MSRSALSSGSRAGALGELARQGRGSLVPLTTQRSDRALNGYLYAEALVAVLAGGRRPPGRGRGCAPCARHGRGREAAAPISLIHEHNWGKTPQPKTNHRGANAYGPNSTRP